MDESPTKVVCKVCGKEQLEHDRIALPPASCVCIPCVIRCVDAHQPLVDAISGLRCPTCGRLISDPCRCMAAGDAHRALVIANRTHDSASDGDGGRC
jgi:hypothetical protein